MSQFIVVPQWQGSDSPRAMQLMDGAEAIAGDLPAARCTRVEVPLEAGESMDSGVRRLSAISHIARNHLDALEASDDVPVTIGGDASVATTAALWAAHRISGGCAVVWFSAHPDLHDPSSSPTGGYTTMAARALIDDTLPRPLTTTVEPSSLILAGARAVASSETEQIIERGIRVVFSDALEPESLAEYVSGTGASEVFIHVDLDVLDPAAISGIADVEPFGIDVATLTDCIRSVRAVANLTGASVTEYAPSSPAAAVNDLGAILRVIAALT